MTGNECVAGLTGGDLIDIGTHTDTKECPITALLTLDTHVEHAETDQPSGHLLGVVFRAERTDLKR